MHWLEGELQRLHGLARACEAAKAGRRPGREEEERAARGVFRDAVSEVLEGMSAREGVSACFAAHEGLLADSRGWSPDFDALAAVAQACLASGADASDKLALGGVQQIVVVGQVQKLAMLVVGPVALGILCPRGVELGSALR